MVQPQAKARKATVVLTAMMLTMLLFMPGRATATAHATHHTHSDEPAYGKPLHTSKNAGESITSTTEAMAGPIGEFVAYCPLSHRLHDDPIVFPGQPHAAHGHDFFGNITADANSTAESLLVGGTTCDPVTDRSSYWAPTLYDAAGQEIAIDKATFYYLVNIDNPASLQPYPVGLKVIAGNAKATTPDEAEHIKWSCLGTDNSSTGDFATCPADSKLELLVNYPDCWNGQDLDSANHKSHMAYSAGGACPATHPVAVPALQFKLRYATPGEAGMKLSSGAGYTAHADFFNAWETAAQENRLQCLRELMKCGPEGHPNPAAQPTATPQPGALQNQLYLPTVKSQ